MMCRVGVLVLLAVHEATSIDNADAVALTNQHNGYRTTHCVASLTWDATLEAAAQAWADTCPEAHTELCSQNDVPHCRGTNPTTLEGSVGENMAWGGIDAATATDNWYNEYTDPGYDFEQDGWTGGTPWGNSGTGHFTQVVWKDSTLIGCGVKKNCDYRSFFGTDAAWASSTSVWVCMCARRSSDAATRPTPPVTALVAPPPFAGTSRRATGL